MQAIIFNLLEEANAFIERIDAALGYPKVGQSTGGGIHVEASLTAHFTFAKKHPYLEQWACPIDAEALPLLREGEIVEELQDNWFNNSLE